MRVQLSDVTSESASVLGGCDMRRLAGRFVACDHGGGKCLKIISVCSAGRFFPKDTKEISVSLKGTIHRLLHKRVISKSFYVTLGWGSFFLYIEVVFLTCKQEQSEHVTDTPVTWSYCTGTPNAVTRSSTS